MLDFAEALLGRFAPAANGPDPRAARAAAGRFASLVGILCNTILFAVKLLIGLLSGSLSIAADAVNNLSDASASVISLLGFKMGAKPADAEHPYGHGRYEYLAGLAVSVLILVIGVELLRSSIGKIIAPTPVAFGFWMAAALCLSILLKGWMMQFNRKVGEKIRSETLIATAADSRNDVFTTAAVLAAALLSRFTGLQLDGWMGLAVAVFILYSGWGLVKTTLDPLLGRAPDEGEVDAIRQKILSYPGVIGTHDLLIHDYGPGRQFATAHVEMSADIAPLRAHAVVDSIERDFLKAHDLNMVVHMDPIADDSTALGRLNEWAEAQVKTIDPALTIHDFCVLPSEEDGKTCLAFDCVAPRNFPVEDEDLRHGIAKLIRQKYPRCACRVTIDRDYAAMPHENDAGANEP